MANNLLLTYTPDSQLKFSQRKRGWPTDDGRGFYPVCNRCDGFGSVQGYEEVPGSFLPRLAYVPCSCCDGSGWAKFALTLNINNIPGVPYYWY